MRSSSLRRRRSPSPLVSDISQSPDVRVVGIATHLEEEDVENENYEETHGLREAGYTRISSNFEVSRLKRGFVSRKKVVPFPAS